MVGVIGWIIVLLQAGEVSHFLSGSVVDTYIVLAIFGGVCIWRAGAMLGEFAKLGGAWGGT